VSTPWDYIDYLKDNADIEEAKAEEAARLPGRYDALENQIRELLAIYDSRPDRQYIGWQADVEEQIEALRRLIS
jgi:hypothetical protein